MLGNDPYWQAAKEQAFMKNAWFIPPFIELAVHNIATHLLDQEALARLVSTYRFDQASASKTVGVIMPGNIPLGGFCDFCSVFLSGHKQRVRLSPKDDVLFRHLTGYMMSLDKAASDQISFEEMLKGCDAYLAMGAAVPGPMEQYFSKYPSIIRRPARTSAILDGTETRAQLELLADDVFQYFGQGYLNITKIYVPRGYDFIPLLKA
ncbi:MAG TPA: acyl-CoA reductase, partial [Chitinophagaceae bacterium]|nr:acyl-CoA reductase [Chitinophagaceae bacterium]